MITTILQLLTIGLQLWQHKDATKYADKVIKLKQRYRDEENKDPANRSDAELDDIEFELRTLCAAFCSVAGAQNAPNLQGQTPA